MPRNTEGKMAWVVGDVHPDDLGKVVTCVKFLGEVPGYTSTDIWEIDKPLNWICNNIGPYFDPKCPDKNLRPFLDPEPDEQDETLSWKPVPDAVTPVIEDGVKV